MIVGSYFHTDADNQVQQHEYGLMPNGRFVQIDVAGATDTIPRTISSADVAGFYLDQSGNLHGLRKHYIKNPFRGRHPPPGVGAHLAGKAYHSRAMGPLCLES